MDVVNKMNFDRFFKGPKNQLGFFNDSVRKRILNGLRSSSRRTRLLESINNVGN